MTSFLIRPRSSRHTVSLISCRKTRSPFTTNGTHGHSQNTNDLSPTRFRRHSTALAPFSSPPQHQIYISQSINPYFNLTFEDWYVERQAARLDPFSSHCGAVSFLIGIIQVVSKRTSRKAPPFSLPGFTLCGDRPEPESVEGNQLQSPALPAKPGKAHQPVARRTRCAHHQEKEWRRNGVSCMCFFWTIHRSPTFLDCSVSTALCLDTTLIRSRTDDAIGSWQHKFLYPSSTRFF